MRQHGQLTQAQALCAAILQEQPWHYPTLHELGVMAYQSGNYRAAADHFYKAIAFAPDNAGYHSNLGMALQDLRQFESALDSYDQALALDPTLAATHSNRGTVLKALGRLEEAVASHDTAIALKPDHADAWTNRGVALKELRRIDAAIASHERAIALQPGHPHAHWNMAIAMLLAGRFEPGWALHEWRWQGGPRGTPQRNFSRPLWLGKECLDGKTILLHAEQGLGDTIQFCRYAGLVSNLGARVVLEVPKALAGLLRELAGVSEVVVQGRDLPDFDFHCPLMSLPLAFKTRIESIPAPQKYLQSEPARLAEWGKRLGGKVVPRIGLAWSGRAEQENDHNRSIPLAALQRALPSGYQYVSLQKEVRESDELALRSPGNILHFGDGLRDFTDTAALCEYMDLIISVDSSVAHLSGALGKPVWVLLCYGADWRWLINRNDSPWYGSAKLYRQGLPGDWDPVLQRVHADLAALSR